MSDEGSPRGHTAGYDEHARAGDTPRVDDPGDVGVDVTSGGDPDPFLVGGGHRKKRRGFSGCLAVLVALVVVLAGAYLVGSKGYHYLKDHLSQAADYPGPGHGHVLFQVKSGDSIAQIGRNLKHDQVVASVDAFSNAANGHTDIQVGYYDLKRKMSAQEAYSTLSDPKNILTTSVTVPEGLRVVDIVSLLAAHTKYSRADFDKALHHPSALGLPSYAHGNPEGYLFPATYGFGPKETPVQMLTDMVSRWKEAAQQDGLASAAQKLGKTPGQLMTIASLVQAEGRGSDMAKVARVIYNRLDGPGDKQGTNGLLQVDATVNYALHRKGVVAVTTAETQNTDSPYNTYLHPGLPPSPIEAPGDAAIQAAAHPATGDWYYYVTVNLRTGETKFAKTYSEFLRYKQQLTQYCQTSSAC